MLLPVQVIEYGVTAGEQLVLEVQKMKMGDDSEKGEGARVGGNSRCKRCKTGVLKLKG